MFKCDAVFRLVGDDAVVEAVDHNIFHQAWTSGIARHAQTYCTSVAAVTGFKGHISQPAVIIPHEVQGHSTGIADSNIDGDVKNIVIECAIRAAAWRSVQ